MNEFLFLALIWLAGVAMGYAFADIRLQLEERRRWNRAARYNWTEVGFDSRKGGFYSEQKEHDDATSF